MTEMKRSEVKRSLAKKSDETISAKLALWIKRIRRTKQKKNVDTQAEPKMRTWVQIRLLPIWLRIILVLLLLVGAAVLGAMFGYGYLGDGNPVDVLKKETWIHITDIFKGKES